MNISGIQKFNTPSFKSVIPVKKIVINDDTSVVNYSQMDFDSFINGNSQSIDSSCDDKTAKKIIQSLNKILLKNDKTEAHTYQNALSNMIRQTFAFNDNDYKPPYSSVNSKDNYIIKPCYTNNKNYILTGREAEKYAYAGREIGGARALVRDYNEPSYAITNSKRKFGYCKEDILSDKTCRLKNKYGSPMGLVIYADKIVSTKKSQADKYSIKAVDFEPVI